MVLFTAEGRQSTKARRVADLTDPPSESYASDSKKEALCLEYVRQFRSKFVALFPKRRELFLAPQNEFGCSKFVCTTVRPTLLPFDQLYEAKPLAKFVANFLQYEPLEAPDAFPSVLPSPTQVVQWKCGDCFDFAILLCSWLQGNGYDAYVVCGYAPSYITLKDQSKLPPPTLEDEPLPPDDESDEEREDPVAQQLRDARAEGRYLYKERGVPESKYEVMMAEREAAEKAAAAKTSDDEESDEEEDAETVEVPDDSSSLHAWVMLRPFKRGITETTFIEPTTGNFYTGDEAPYHGVESVFNANNYWVNMQEQSKRCGSLETDLDDTDHWEFVFMDPMPKKKEVPVVDGPPPLPGDVVESEEEEEDNILDLPPSWVSSVALKMDDFVRCYPPDGTRTTLYKKAKLELFAAGTNDQGLISRLVLYDDSSRTSVKECVERFKYRRDLLRKRRRVPSEARLEEDFLPGRLGGLKTLVEVAGRRREYAFHAKGRTDGLLTRVEDVGEKVVETFAKRPDRLVYRALRTQRVALGAASKLQYTLPAAEGSGELIVEKMTQKFAPDGEETGEDVDVRRFRVKEGRIETKCHYKKHAVTRPTILHEKGGADAAEDEDLQRILKAERDCLAGMRKAQIEVLELLKTRRREEATVVVDRPVFETAREKKASEGTTIDSAGDPRAVDYLTPFLAHVVDPASITHDEAQRARDACLKSLKERLVERANIMMARLTEENSKLSKKQAAYQRNARDRDAVAEEEFERFCAEAMFRIQILEQRLASHEETALKKFQDLDAKLAADPRMRALQE
jgi:hypothetical protein